MMKRFFSVIAFLLLFSGFGMIHGATKLMEKMGSAFIGAGALYFIVLIALSMRKQKREIE